MNLRIPALAMAGLLMAAACTTGSSPGDPAPGGSPDLDAAWRTAPLRDSRTGETFTVNDLAGKLVAIEPMAVWCSSCKIQQLEAAAALAQLDDPDIVYVSVSVDPNERDQDLADYADLWGFDWRFVVADADLARALADAFGPQILSPPSTPMILVAPSGEVVEQHFGIRGASDLVELFDAHRS